MANMLLTTRGPVCKTFTLTGGTDRPWTRNAITGQLLLNLVVISDLIGPISRIRLRAPSTNAATVLYGDSAVQQIPLVANTAMVINERWEHIQNPENLYFVGTANDVVQFDVYI